MISTDKEKIQEWIEFVQNEYISLHISLQLPTMCNLNWYA